MLVNLLQKDFDIQLKEYSSKSEILSDLSLCRKGHIILENSEYDYRFISVKISPSYEKDSYGVGFWCSNLFFTPNVLLYNNVLVISFDNYVALFNVENNSEPVTYAFSYPIEHLELYNNTLIAISELDFIQLNISGEILSESPFDSCLQSFEIIDNKIICNTEKGKSEYTIL